MIARDTPLALAAVAMLAACECSVREAPPHQTPGAEQVAAPGTPEPVPAPEEGCAAGTPSILTSSGERSPAVAVAISGQRALVVHPKGEGQLEAWPTDPLGAPLGEATTFALPSASELLAFEAVGPRFVAVTTGPCPEGDEALECFFARAVDADGNALGRPVVVPHTPLRSVRVRASEDGLHLAWSGEDGAVHLERFRAEVDGVDHDRTRLGGDRDLEGVHVEVLGLALSDSSWAVVWRAGPAEDASSDVLLSRPGSDHEVEPLHHALVIEQMQLSGDEVTAIAAFEFSRPKLVRLRSDGAPLGEHTIAAGEPVPEPFTEARAAGVQLTDGNLRLVLRDGAGDRTETLDLLGSSNPEVPHRGDVTRSGNGFLVAFTGPEANGFAVGTVRVQCAP